MEEFLNGLRRARAEYARKKTIGERFIVPREGEEGVDVLLSRPKINAKETLPVLFNLHGGAWSGGDAVLMESFCQKIADETPAMVCLYTHLDVYKRQVSVRLCGWHLLETELGR